MIFLERETQLHREHYAKVDTELTAAKSELLAIAQRREAAHNVPVRGGWGPRMGEMINAIFDKNWTEVERLANHFYYEYGAMKGIVDSLYRRR